MSVRSLNTVQAVKIPHRAIIANTVQLALHQRVDQPSPNRGFRNGDNLLGSEFFDHASLDLTRT